MQGSLMLSPERSRKTKICSLSLSRFSDIHFVDAAFSVLISSIPFLSPSFQPENKSNRKTSVPVNMCKSDLRIQSIFRAGLVTCR